MKDRDYWECEYKSTKGKYARCIANKGDKKFPILLRKASLETHALIPGDNFQFHYRRLEDLGEVESIEPIIGKPLSEEEINKYRKTINKLSFAKD